MHKIVMIFVILSTIFLSACRSRPEYLTTKQKFIKFEFIEIDGKKYIDPETSFCVERDYLYSVDKLGPLNKFKNIPIEKCDKMTGHNPSDYVELNLFLDDVRREIKSYE